MGVVGPPGQFCRTGGELQSGVVADKELSGEPATELAQCLGNWTLSMEPRKLLQPGCDNGRGWEARVHARSLGDSGVIIGCDLEAEPGLQKIG